MESSQRTLLGIYYLGVLALIVAGVILWVTGHGTGDPYLTVGIALALVPIVVKWIRDRFRRD
jgi:Co/Zn/Cd efflux system component